MKEEQSFQAEFQEKKRKQAGEKEILEELIVFNSPNMTKYIKKKQIFKKIKNPQKREIQKEENLDKSWSN